jgi:hypothetical protein
MSRISRVTCRCGEVLKISANDPEHICCPNCGARIRLRRAVTGSQAKSQPSDGYLRFHCPCGRRLKVSAQERPTAGKCPDCGRIVPVPVSLRSGTTQDASKRSTPNDPEARTEEMDSNELARLERWAARHNSRSFGIEGAGSTPAFVPIVTRTDPTALKDFPPSSPASVVKFEAGLRICPRCQKPIHLGTSVCRACGTPVPRR